MELDDFKNRIIEEAFSPKCSQLEIERLLEMYFGRLPIPTLQANYLFIGRCRYNKPGEVFNNVSQLSYNPKCEEIGLQRCNYKGQQVFYGAAPTNSSNASMLSTAILEICLEYIKDEDIDTHYMTLSRWQIRRPLEVFVLPYSKQSVENNGDFKTAKENFDNVLATVLPTDTALLEFYKRSLEFISDIFCKTDEKEKYYKISAAYYNFIMNSATKKGRVIDGLIYPSANTEATGMNIVLKKELIDDKTLYCDNAVMYKGQRYPNKKKHFFFGDASNTVEIGDNGEFAFTSIW